MSIANKAIDKQFQGQLVRRYTPRGSWGTEASSFTPQRSSSKKSTNEPVSIKFLTDGICARITSFYQLAVKQNIGDCDAIYKSIEAIPLHLAANIENAEHNHSKCPIGNTSWYRYNRAIAEGVEPPSHPNYLSQECVELVSRVFDKYNYNKIFLLSKLKAKNE